MGLERIYAERLKLIPIASEMEDRGVTLSAERLYGLKDRYRKESIASGRTCVSIAADLDFDLELPKSGNNGSLLEFVFDQQYLGLTPMKYSEKTGAPSLDKDTIDYWMLTLDPGPALDFLSDLRDKRRRDKACEALTGYEKFWLPYKGGNKTWRVLHPNYNPCGTDHLRWSSSNPNSQNCSKKTGFNLRQAFGPAPGREMWTIDFRNVELRIPAVESGEQDLIDLFEKSEEPPYFGSEHLLNFSVVYPEIWAKELAEQMKNPDHIKTKYKSENYQWCKNGDFALGYNCGRAKADATFRVVGAFDMLKSRFAKKEKLNQHWVRHANKYGFVETIPDKLVDPARGYPILVSRTEDGRSSTTTPLNYHVSGTAMQTSNAAIILCHDQCKEWQRQGFDAFITLEIHDELAFDLPRGDTKLANLPRARQLKRLMESCGERIGIPTPCSMELHTDNWSTGESYA